MRKIISIVFLIFILFGRSSAQDINPEYPDPPRDSNYTFQSLDTMPEYPGGIAEVMKYVMRNFKYPRMNMDNDSTIICGRIYLGFIVERDGSVSNMKVIKTMPNCGPWEKEGVKALTGMEKWKPGIWHGCTVRVQYNLPLRIEYR